MTQPGPQDPQASRRILARAGSGLTIRHFTIEHDAPGLDNGVDFYTPTAGELLLGCWASVVTPWDADPAVAVDIGPFLDGDVQGFYGLGYNAAPFGVHDPSTIGQRDDGAGWIGSGMTRYGPEFGLVLVRLLTAAPLKVVVSTTGQKGGGDPGATTGELEVLIATATLAG